MKIIIYSNLLPFVSLIATLFLLQHNHLFNKYQSKLFRLAIYIVSFMMVIISLDYLFYLDLSEIPYSWVFHRITSCLNFAMSPFIPILLYNIFSGKRPRIYYYIPCIMNAVICFTSIFWKLVFWIGPKHTYFRGPLFFIPFCISIIYIVLLIINMGKFTKKGKSSERIFLLGVIGMLIVCMYLEIIQFYKFLTWDCVAYSMILYYLLININNANSDPLTGAFNRAMYMKKLSEIDRSDACTVAFMDINNFKYINDTMGHDAGDKYLIRFTIILQNEMEKGTALYRIGGDEFAVLSMKWDEVMMRSHLEHTLYQTHAEQFEFAYGIASYNPMNSIEEAIQAADQNMYQHKKQLKNLVS